MIYVYDAFWCRFVPVPAIDQEYAKGLTEWQHDVICKFIRRTNQSRVNRKALVEAKEYIRQRIAQEFGRKPKKLKSASSVAKWLTFEDPTEARIIYRSKKGTEPENDGQSGGKLTAPEPKLLKGKTKFVPSTEESDKPLEWKDDENWDALYSDSNKEDL
jgi:hypothetical protein